MATLNYHFLKAQAEWKPSAEEIYVEKRGVAHCTHLFFFIVHPFASQPPLPAELQAATVLFGCDYLLSVCDHTAFLASYPVRQACSCRQMHTCMRAHVSVRLQINNHRHLRTNRHGKAGADKKTASIDKGTMMRQ